MKKTDWYPADVKPVRVGWYEKDFGPQLTFPDNAQFWDGFGWRYGSAQHYLKNTPNLAPGDDPMPRWWRGLTEPQS